jgi:hypothetical protein
MRHSITITEATTKRLLAGLLISAAVAVVLPSAALADEYDVTSGRVALEKTGDKASLTVQCRPTYRLKSSISREVYFEWLGSYPIWTSDQTADVARGTFTGTYTNINPFGSGYAQVRVTCTNDAPPQA